jgi:hypothetical protein
MPVMEVIPFSASGAGAALTAFGLALIAHDGLTALFALDLHAHNRWADPLSRDLTCADAYNASACCWPPADSGL